MKYCLSMLILCLWVLSLSPNAEAAQLAADLSGKERVTAYSGFSNIDGLFDGNAILPITAKGPASLTLEAAEGIGALYLIFDKEYDVYTVTDEETGVSQTFGHRGFLHDFLDLEKAFGAPLRSLTLAFDGEAKLNEVYLFSAGEVPGFVQRWQTPTEGAVDLLLFSAHGDDEQLFFAGLLPYYAGEKDYEVLVAYLTDHRNCVDLRCHEMLNGLWAVGVQNYPVFGPFGDYYSRSKEQALELHQKNGETEEELLGYVVEQLRRYRPQVAVGHDVNRGEYGHGQHMLYADLLCRALPLAADPSVYPESAQQWSAWEVPKTYLHLWPEGQICMNWDQPLACFDGMTAFEVSQKLGFPSHKSQYWGFAWYISEAETASDISQYSPCQYGLYKSTVGADAEGGDFFENLWSYEDQRKAKQVVQMGIDFAHLLRKTGHLKK